MFSPQNEQNSFDLDKGKSNLVQAPKRFGKNFG